MMHASPEQIRELIITHLLELPEGFADNADLFEAGLDSMAIMQLLLLLEEQYSVQIPMGEVSHDNFGTTRAIARLVGSKQSPVSDH